MTTEAAVSFDAVSKSFGSLKVLDRVSFDVQAGRTLCILGRSGTGKSVMLRQMIGLIRPDEGKIFINGRDIAQCARAELSSVRKGIGFLFQYSALFDSISVGENVAFPLRRHTRLSESEIRDRAGQLLDQVGLERDYDKMPSDVSGGMRKRVGLARAMALDPEILLVDEPSSGLDPVTAAEIDELLLDLKRKGATTLVVVTHNIPSALRLADVVMLLHEGRVLESGAPKEFAASPHELVQQFLSAQGGT